ncbi:dTDP-4-amino-4,6-dideoxygalactose transaminase [Saccharothrix saharensis]|uniref:dTDP-4-amino-4,6-dideoxygalactose transaminase n=1 Tax=Saccharothrix saharensis TaxID=571190 RepID=A0A543J845_9PSEU|nr:bifunctional SDR family oxidoreductase/aminotransferase class I/II-fold pyridoxal phosphate-dependent enzyme [Saccharothrix saharensis]TQM78997.1 dTDP-4-amino-4,6-dideoxygalactose transaminase [Saccharothrix saharensis]
MVTGAGGYLGSVLLPVLLKAGHEVVAVDKFYFGDHPLNGVIGAPGVEIRRCDVRDVAAADLVGVDTVISLAAISNDPAGDLAPDWTVQVNQDATIRLAELAVEEGVSRFVFASSCSVYGAGGDSLLDESARQRPLTVYASTKQATEQALNALASDKFRVISLRMATLFGVSPRMRLDLVVNRMVSHAVSGRPIQVHGGGQWRPLLHVRDAAAAYLRCVDLPLEDLPLGDAFNVVGENVTVGGLAERVAKQLGGVPLEIREGGPDQRSYRVSQEKFAKLTGFLPATTVERGVEELHRALSAEAVATDDPRYSTVASLKAVVAKPAREGGEQVRRAFLPFALPLIGREEEQEVLDTLRSGWLTTGPKTKRFEAQCAEYLGVRHAIAMNSCTGALHVGLAALGIGPGDEVVTTPVSWPATANVVLHLGATPVFVDVEADTLNIDPDLVEQAITSRTKAILPVHMAGQTCDMDALLAIAERHGLPVVEDAAHAMGATHGDRKVGGLGTAAAFSFYPTKNMTTGEGGLLVTDDDAVAERARVLSLHGISKDAWKRYSPDASLHWELIEPGYKYNMTDVQASLGLHQLRKLDAFREVRARYAARYDEAIADLAALRPLARRGFGTHSHHLYVVALDLDLMTVTRDEFMIALREEGIGTGVHFRSMHLQPYYRDNLGMGPEELPVAADVSERILSLPLYPKMTGQDVEDVVRAVRKVALAYTRTT